MSDIHLEFEPFQLSWCGEDVLVIAGDVAEFKNRCKAIRLFTRYLDNCPAHIVFVTGNHEYYGSDINTVDTYWHYLNLPRFHFLNAMSVIINVNNEQVRFLGGTLWTDYQRGTKELMMLCKTMSNDYQNIYTNQIHTKDNLFTPEYSVLLHDQQRQLLKILIDNISKDEENIVNVMVSHHLPSYACVNNKYDGNVGNAMYACTDMDELLDSGVIKYWIHGHTHVNVDKMIRGVRVLCNPHGYNNENMDFVTANIFTV